MLNFGSTQIQPKPEENVSFIYQFRYENYAEWISSRQ